MSRTDDPELATEALAARGAAALPRHGDDPGDDTRRHDAHRRRRAPPRAEPRALARGRRCGSTIRRSPAISRWR